MPRIATFHLQVPPPYSILPESPGLVEEYVEKSVVRDVSKGLRKAKMVFVVAFTRALHNQADMITFLPK